MSVLEKFCNIKENSPMTWVTVTKPVSFWGPQRQRLRGVSDGYVNVMNRRTLPNDDTGILRQAQDERFFPDHGEPVEPCRDR